MVLHLTYKSQLRKQNVNIERYNITSQSDDIRRSGNF
jgi:hypothetical protein